jgi:hypothetical protein
VTVDDLKKKGLHIESELPQQTHINRPKYNNNGINMFNPNWASGNQMNIVGGQHRKQR